MTASLARNEKGMAALGRCLIAATIPRRQQRRVSNLVPHAGVHSAPNTSSGPAVSSYIFAPQGHLSPAGAGGRVERVGSATASFLHLGRRPSQNAAQHFTKSFCPVAPSVFGSAHERNHEGVLRREVVNLCQGFGNVCRA